MNTGDRLRDAIVRHIQGWQQSEIQIKTEKPVGFRFIGKPRKLDIILQHEGKYLGIEAKYQGVGGTAYQKLQYALDDLTVCPIPAIIIFAGKEIVQDIKARLIGSGRAIEVEFKMPVESDPSKDYIEDEYNLLRQRIYIELGLDWFPHLQS